MNPPVQNTAALRDIHLPDAISWWPPAIGWWLLLVLIILFLYFAPKIYRYFTFIPFNKVAEENFQDIITNYNQSRDVLELVSKLSILLRQISMTHSGRESVAQLTGEEWLNHLNSMTSKHYFDKEVKELLINAPYQQSHKLDPQPLIVAVQNWISALPKRPTTFSKSNLFMKPGNNK